MNILDYETIFDYRGESYNNAIAKHPNARHFERQALIDLIHFTPASHLLDAPAGGGYVASGIREQIGPGHTITCIEPAANFARGITHAFNIINGPIDQIPLDDGSVDIIASLSGLHHIENRAGVFLEWARVLKSGGQIAVADVAEGSGVDQFLNIFVDKYTPQGHEGIFFPKGELSRHLTDNGFNVSSESITAVPWVFSTEQDMAEFCIALFYLQNVEKDEVLENLEKHVGIDRSANGEVAIKWSLCYAHGTKT